MNAQRDTTSMRDVLYEQPGPKTQRKILIGTIIASLVLAVGIAAIVQRFYVTGQLSAKYWRFFTYWTTWRFLGEGFVGTLEVSITAGILALILGLVLMLGRRSKIRVLSTISRVVINFFRGVPSLLLIYFFFLVIPQYGLRLPAFWMLTWPIAFAASGVLAEVLRAGMNAVPKGQREAAISLGMSRMQTTFKIVLPQAIKFVIPSLISQLVVVVKDTTVAYIVSYPDLLQNARVLVTNYDALVSTYFVVALIYIVLNYIINQLSVYLARRSGTQVLGRSNEEPV